MTRRTLLTAATCLLLAGCAAPASPPTASTGSAPAAAAPSATAKAATAANEDQGWVLVGKPALKIQYGMVTGTARVKNGSDKTTATVQITYGADTASPIVLVAAINNLAPGKTTTVQLTSTDKATKVPSGTPEFRVTASF